jgi:hypothetical protein
MSNAPDPEHDAELRPYYDFSKGEVGKYHKRYHAGTNLVKLDDDVARDFPTSEAVNEALRKYRDLGRTG